MAAQLPTRAPGAEPAGGNVNLLKSWESMSICTRSIVNVADSFLATDYVIHEGAVCASSALCFQDEEECQMAPSIWSDVRAGGSRTTADHRSVQQQDYDRVLFSTPVRRLADKTQVFPLDKNDGIRTRLTHSHEVANLARSIGSRLIHEGFDFGGVDNERIVLPILSTIGLAHDLGNPPFGHRGEAAICEWFCENSEWIFDYADCNKTKELEQCVPAEIRREFTKFDGNPQSLRLLTQLQTSPASVGLDLSAATLAASLKYSVSVESVDKKNAASKKYGYFASEAPVISWIREATGLKEGQRHPLTWIMEACDDIAYSILDVEDSIKKFIISPDDILNILEHECSGEITYKLRDRFKRSDDTGRPAPIIRDMKAGYFRASAVDVLVDHAAKAFRDNKEAIYGHTHTEALMDSSLLCGRLKKIAIKYAFGNSEVLKAEAEGSQALKSLMSWFWSSIVNRDGVAIDSVRAGANDRLAFSLISHNYIDAVKDSESKNCNKDLSMRYRELRLLTDMVSGMTDTFCIDLYKKLKSLYT